MKTAEISVFKIEEPLKKDPFWAGNSKYNLT
jgi:hypothetical protein